MEDSILGYNHLDNSLKSKEKDTTITSSTTSNSFESQSPISDSLKNHIISAITSNLKDIIETYQKQGNNQYLWKDNVFYLEQIPPISIEKYIHHLMKYTNMNISTLILSIIYIDKFCEKVKYVLSYHNIYRLLLISIFISLKFNEDLMVSAQIYSNIAGVSVEDLKMLEYLICTTLDFKFFVDSDYYQLYFNFFSK